MNYVVIAIIVGAMIPLALYLLSYAYLRWQLALLDRETRKYVKLCLSEAERLLAEIDANPLP